MISKLPWMNDDDHLAMCCIAEYSNEYNQKFKRHPLMNGFASDSMVTFLYGSNVQEGTLPECKGDTFLMVRDHFRRGELFNIDKNRQWDANGKFSNQAKDQIFRHFNAKLILDTKSALTIENVKRVHSILMSNSVDSAKNQSATVSLGRDLAFLQELGKPTLRLSV